MKLAAEAGVAPEKIFLVEEKGDVINYNGKDMILNEKVNSEYFNRWYWYCDVNIVLRDRHLLAEDGIFIAVVTLDPKNRRIAAGPEIQLGLYMYVKVKTYYVKQKRKYVK